MTIPKRRNYKLLFIAVAGCVLMSSFLIVGNTILARALSAPEGFKGFQSLTQNDGPKQDDRKDTKAEQQRRDATKTPVTASPAPVSPSQVKQSTNAQPTKAAAVKTTQAPAPRAPVSAQANQSSTSPQKPTDTSALVRSVASAQASKPAHAVQYSSAKISSYERDRLYKGSLIVAAVGGLLYMASYAASVWHWARRGQVGVRETITQ